MIAADPAVAVIDTPLGEQRFEIADGRLKITCPARDELLLVDVDLGDFNEELLCQGASAPVGAG